MSKTTSTCYPSIDLGETVSDKFQLATRRVTTLPVEPSPDIMLRLYALYKQSTLGDVCGKRPGRLDFKGRAKYDCWAYRRGMSKEEAQQRYENLVDDLLKRAGMDGLYSHNRSG